MVRTSVLFLDMDDVMIVPSIYKIKSKRRARDGRKVHYAFLPSARTCLFLILSLCPDTAIVISSTWRLEGRRELDTMLRLNGCGEWIERLHEDWRTCEPARDLTRAAEIAEWLSRHPEIERAVAIDNDPSIEGEDWGILIDPAIGLSEETYSTVIARLRDRDTQQGS